MAERLWSGWLASVAARQERPRSRAPIPPPAARSGRPPTPSQRPARPAHSHFAATAAVTLLLLVLANAAVQVHRRFFDVLSSGGMGNEYDLLKVQECESLGRTPDVLLVGSSRAENGEAAPVVDQTLTDSTGARVLTCNIGMSGSTFESDYFAFKRMVKDGYVPRLVVENAFEYNINANGGADSYYPAIHHATWLADASDVGAFRVPTSGHPDDWAGGADFLAQKLIPIYGDRVGLLKAMCQQVQWGPCGERMEGVSWANRFFYLHDPYLGWHPLTDRNMAEQTADERQSIASELAFFRANYVQNFQLLHGPPEYLSKLVSLAHAYHVQVALVVTPLHTLYRELLSPAQWQAIMAYWRTFSGENGVAFFDESQAAGYTDADFRDPHHLAATGAEKFARWMALNVVAPALGLQHT
jgi:hypothetical protein